MKGQTNQYILAHKLQRKLRKAMTDAEKKLWQQLRGKQFDSYKFRRQHPFGDFVLDFVCLEAKLFIEVDGGQHSESARDLVRDQSLQSAGFRILRFWNNQVLNEIEAVVEAIWFELHPSPPQPLYASTVVCFTRSQQVSEGLHSLSAHWDTKPVGEPLACSTDRLSVARTVV